MPQAHFFLSPLAHNIISYVYLETHTIVGLVDDRRQKILPITAFRAYFLYRLDFQRPNRHVSVGGVGEVKPDVEDLGQLHRVLDFIPSEVGRNFAGGIHIACYHAWP